MYKINTLFCFNFKHRWCVEFKHRIHIINGVRYFKSVTDGCLFMCLKPKHLFLQCSGRHVHQRVKTIFKNIHEAVVLFSIYLGVGTCALHGRKQSSTLYILTKDKIIFMDHFADYDFFCCMLYLKSNWLSGFFPYLSPFVDPGSNDRPKPCMWNVFCVPTSLYGFSPIGVSLPHLQLYLRAQVLQPAKEASSLILLGSCDMSVTVLTCSLGGQCKLPT